MRGQGYRTPRGAVMDEYGAMVKWRLVEKIDELVRNPAPVALCRPGLNLGHVTNTN
jgi:hypothetical protein